MMDSRVATWEPYSLSLDLESGDVKRLPDSVFAFPGWRQLPMTRAEEVWEAVIWINQVLEIPAEERQQALNNIRAAADYYGVRLDPEDMPPV